MTLLEAVSSHMMLKRDGVTIPAPTASAPRRRARIAAAVLIGCAAVAIDLALWAAGISRYTDFDQIWIAARALLGGRDPYSAVAVSFHWPLFYPLTAVISTLPFAALPKVLAGPVFVGVSFSILAYGMTARAWWPLIALLSYPAFDAAQSAQWSPVLTAVAFFPWLSWIALSKPTSGGAIVGAYAIDSMQSKVLRVCALVGVGIIVISFLVWPHWLAEWVATVRQSRHFVPLVLRPGGFLLLAALLRWRRSEARLLAFLSVVPATASPYEALPLLLLISTRREAFAFSWLSIAAVPWLAVAIGNSANTGVFVAAIAHNAVVLMLALYLPALVMVLRRPNEGTAPEWLERLLARAPGWLRGSATPATSHWSLIHDQEGSARWR